LLNLKIFKIKLQIIFRGIFLIDSDDEYNKNMDELMLDLKTKTKKLFEKFKEQNKHDKFHH